MEIVSDKPIDPSEVYGLIKKHTAGSIVFHFAVVRPSTENKTTNSIIYEISQRHRKSDRKGL
jgi:molybdopterin synthase catalytic subunit